MLRAGIAHAVICRVVSFLSIFICGIKKRLRMVANVRALVSIAR